jgi:hypothetical protein
VRDGTLVIGLFEESNNWGHQLHNRVPGETTGNSVKPAPTAYQVHGALRRLVRCRWVVEEQPTPFSNHHQTAVTVQH